MLMGINLCRKIRFKGRLNIRTKSKRDHIVEKVWIVQVGCWGDAGKQFHSHHICEVDFSKDEEGIME